MDDAQDLVSVVIPVYNAGDRIGETLECVFNQDYPNLEIVVVDDGSTDGSLEYLRQFTNRIKLVQQPNSGAAAARNAGVKQAQGRWIAFLDADDIWETGKISAQVAEAGNGARWIYTDTLFVGGVNDGKRDSDLNHKIDGDILEQIACSNFIGTSSVFVERDVFLAAGGFDENLRSVHDWDLWVRVASICKIKYLNQPLVRYTIHASSTSRSTRKTLPNHLRVIRKSFGSGGAAERVAHLQPAAMANSYSICSQISEEEGDYSFAISCAFQALRQQPLMFQRYNRLTRLLVKAGLRLVGFRR